MTWRLVVEVLLDHVGSDTFVFVRYYKSQSDRTPKEFKYVIEDSFMVTRRYSQARGHAVKVIDLVWEGTPLSKQEIANSLQESGFFRNLHRTMGDGRSTPTPTPTPTPTKSKEEEEEEEVVEAEPPSKVPQAKVVGGLVQGIFDSLFGSTP